MEEEAETARYDGILGCVHDFIVSADILKDPHGSVVDLAMIKVVGGTRRAPDTLPRARSLC